MWAVRDHATRRTAGYPVLAKEVDELWCVETPEIRFADRAPLVASHSHLGIERES